MNVEALAEPLAAIGRAWVSHLWFTAPAVAVTLAALAARVLVVRRSLRGFSAKTGGLWLDGRTSLEGTLERADAGDPPGGASPSPFVLVGRAHVTKPGTRPATPAVTLASELRLRLADGGEVEIPEGAPVTFSLFNEKLLAVDPESTKAATGAGYERAIRVREGAPVWMVARLIEHQTNAGPMRSSLRRAVAPGQPVELYTTAPTPPECSFDGAYALVWCALLGSGWIATADGWRVAAMALEALWAVLAVASLNRTLGYSKALRARGA